MFQSSPLNPLHSIAKISQARSAAFSEIARITLFDLIDNGEHVSLVRSLNAQNLAEGLCPR